MKKHEYNVMSNEQCDTKECRKKIKLNVALRKKQRPLVCYNHYMKVKDAQANR